MKKVLFFISVGCIGMIILSIFSQKVLLANQNIEISHPMATVTFSNGEEIQIELYPEEAPGAVKNFIYLASQDFYQGTFINRIIPGYLIQAGDPIGDGYGYPGYFIKSECKYNGVKNRLTHIKGTVSMARSAEFNTEGSQFFILLEDDRNLNGQYTSFGRVIKGMEVLEKMTTLELDENYMPRQSITIESIEIELNEYPKEQLEPISVGK